MNKHTKLLLGFFIFMSACFFCIKSTAATVEAASFSIVKTSYSKHHKAYLKLNYFNVPNAKIYYKYGSRVKTLTLKGSAPISAISDGTNVLYKKSHEKTVYKWTPSTGKKSKFTTIKASSSVEGYYKGTLFYSHFYGNCEAEQSLYRHFVSGNKSTLIRKFIRVACSYGPNIYFTNGRGDMSASHLYSYNVNSKKVKSISSNCIIAAANGVHIYYVKMSKRNANYTMSLQIRRQTIANGRDTLIKTVDNVSYVDNIFSTTTFRYILNGKLRTLRYR